MEHVVDAHVVDVAGADAHSPVHIFGADAGEKFI